MNHRFSWRAVLHALREQLPADEYRAWVRPLRPVVEDEKRILVEAPNDRFARILRESYQERIDQLVDQLFGEGHTVEIAASQMALGGTLIADPQTMAATPEVASSSSPSDTSTGVHADSNRLEARATRQPQAAFLAASSDSRFEQSKDPAQAQARLSERTRRSELQPNTQPGNPSMNAPAASQSHQNQVASGGSRFNPKYRFTNFVVGDSNQFACAAARAVAEAPGHSYNPLFLYGGVGLGKTHLLHAIGQEIQQLQPQLLVHYISAEQFLNELINSIRFDRMPAFRERYRGIDVLLIDDIQFLANKERTQEEFFHTFNALYTAEKQIILSSDASPKDIPTLEERLRSRFEWGLITDIQPPDLETKVAILRRKAALRQCDLDDEVAMFIAKQVRSNVRELEGLLNRVVAFASMSGRPLDLDLAKETLKEILPQTDDRRNAAEIIRTVAKTYGLKVAEIKSRNKAQQVSFPRQVAMYLCKQLTDLSFPEIGKQFGNKHHSTVMHSVDKIANLRKEDDELDRSIERLVLQLR